MSQQRIDFDAPVARTNDPAPSHAAAKAVRPKLVGLREEAYRRACILINDHGDATASEIGRAMEHVDDMARCESIRKRVRELVVSGYLIEAGTRVCRKTGSNVTVFKLKNGG
jgi:hypothetical protein